MSDDHQSDPASPARTLREVPPVPRRPRDEDYAPAPAQDRRMIVGREISLSGSIADCDVLVVEGDVTAEIETRVIEVAAGGTFRGTARVENAEISGTFDGELTVAGLLRVLGGGRALGTIRFHRLEVANGGELAGDVAVLAPEAAPEPDAAAQPDGD